jgi:hypothetical protein
VDAMKILLSPESLLHAKNAATDMLVGALLDSIRVFSLEVQLGFSRLPAVNPFPFAVWLCTMARLDILREGAAQPALEAECPDAEFFQSRAVALSQLHGLIGREITSLEIHPGGAFEIVLDRKRLIIRPNNNDFDEVWAIRSDSPEPFGQQGWSVVLDQNQLNVRRPA